MEVLAETEISQNPSEKYGIRKNFPEVLGRDTGGEEVATHFPISKFMADQGHSTSGVTITKLQSFLSNLLSPAPGLRREALGW